MIVATAAGRVFDHFAQAELTLPADPLPWRTGPVVRGLRLLPVRYELAAKVLAADPASAPRPGGPDPRPRSVDSQTRGLLSALKRLMFGGQRGGH